MGTILTPSKIARCHVEDCPGMAIAYLQTKVMTPQGSEIRESVGHCQEHAMQRHNELMKELEIRYDADTFQNPEKL